MDTELMHRAVCLFTSQLLLVLTALPTEDGQTELTPGCWLHTGMVYLLVDGHPSKYYPSPALINFAQSTTLSQTTAV